jgi:hypothetical protein
MRSQDLGRRRRRPPTLPLWVRGSSLLHIPSGISRNQAAITAGHCCGPRVNVFPGSGARPPASPWNLRRHGAGRRLASGLVQATSRPRPVLRPGFTQNPTARGDGTQPPEAAGGIEPLYSALQVILRGRSGRTYVRQLRAIALRVQCRPSHLVRITVASASSNPVKGPFEAMRGHRRKRRAGAALGRSSRVRHHNGSSRPLSLRVDTLRPSPLGLPGQEPS